MKTVILSAIGLLALAATADAAVPFMNATCPTNIEVHADQGGPVFINGKEAKLNIFNDNYYEASHGQVTISVSINPDGSPSVSYARHGSGNGICQVAKAGGGGSAGGGSGGTFDMRGHGTVTLGGPTSGEITSRNGRTFALIITAVRDGFTCTGSFDKKPGKDSMSTPIHCTDGATGLAIMSGTNSNGHMLTFNTSAGAGGFVQFR